MSLVENAFKHSGIGMQPDAFITISVTETEGNKLVFSVQNSKMHTNETISQYGGVGLQNISKRLLLNYPGNHELKINNSEESFSIKLTIPFL
jgi:two-component system, LytTR family, sensor kinase